MPSGDVISTEALKRHDVVHCVTRQRKARDAAGLKPALPGDVQPAVWPRSGV